MTNADRVLEWIGQRPGLWFDDDQLSEALGIKPRQAINQICRRLAAEGHIARERRGGKIHNSAGPIGAPAAGASHAPASASLRRGAVTHDTTSSVPTVGISGSRQALMDALHQTGDMLNRHDQRGLAAALGNTASDPRSLLVELRRSLERVLTENLGASAPGLAAKIDALAGRLPTPIRHHMHTIRTLGNEAAHGGDDLSWADALPAVIAMNRVLDVL